MTSFDEDDIPESLLEDYGPKRVNVTEYNQPNELDHEVASRDFSESIVTERSSPSTSVHNSTGTSGDTVLLGRLSPSDIEESGQSESRRSSGYNPSLSESHPSSVYDTSQSDRSRRSSVCDPSQSESRRTSIYDPNQSESRRSSVYDPSQSESRRTSVHTYSQEEFESLSGSQSQHSSALRFSRHFSDSDRRQSYTDDFDSLNESDHSDADNEDGTRMDNKYRRQGTTEKRETRSRSLVTSDDELYDYNAESFESYENSDSLKYDNMDKKNSAHMTKSQSGALESRSAGLLIDSPRMYGRSDEKPPLSARTIPSSEDLLRSDADKVLRAFVLAKIQTVRGNRASRRSTSAAQKRSLMSPSKNDTQSKDSHALRMFCRLKRDQLKNRKKNADMSRSGSLLPSTESTGGFTTQTMIVPEAFMKKVRQNKILARHHEIDFHEPSECPDCRTELDRNAMLDFASRKKAIALENLVSYRLENIIAKDGLTSFGEYLADFAVLKKDRDLVFDCLMRPLYQKTALILDTNESNETRPA